MTVILLTSSVTMQWATGRIRKGDRAGLNRAIAITLILGVVFLAHVYGVEIPMSVLGGGLLATFLVSLTVAPVPSASVMTLAPALDAVGVPLDGVAILLGIDRIPDMFRTVLNATGQLACATVVDGQTRTTPRRAPGPDAGGG